MRYVPTPTPTEPPLRMLGHYLLEAPLGAGGQGQVFRGVHRPTGLPVALKRVAEPSPRERYRLKHEFRVCAELRHPNLVAMYELVEEGPECYFAMELVEGAPLYEHVRRSLPHGVPLDEGGYARLATSLAQLLDCLAFLHESGHVHGDVKPTNVVVRPDGRLALLDFGLALGLSDRYATRVEDPVRGTLAYMAPELPWGAPLRPACDVYSAGALALELARGAPPFSGSIVAMTRDKRAFDVEGERSLAGAPGWARAFIAGALEPEPAVRRSARQLWRDLPERARAGVVQRRGGGLSVLSGRESEVATLEGLLARTLAGGSAYGLVLGPSGAGKTALLTNVCAALAGTGRAWILRSLCRPHATVLFPCLDELVDGLSLLLPSARAAGMTLELEPNAVASLLQVFPVLAADAGLGELGAEGELPVAPNELRRSAVHCLRRILRAVAATKPLVILLDDLHWADSDGARMLRDLLADPESHHVCVLAAARGAALAARADLRTALTGVQSPEVTNLRVKLAPLPPSAIRAIATSCSGITDDAVLDAIAAEAQGNPYVAVQLAHLACLRPEALHRAGPVSADAELAAAREPITDAARSGAEAPSSAATPTLDPAMLIRARLGLLSEDAQRLLAVASAAFGPLPLPVLSHAAGLTRPIEAVRALMNARHLVAEVRLEPSMVLQPHHARVADAVLAGVDDDGRRRLHVQIADAIVAEGIDAPVTLVRHLRAAGRLREASARALSAAQQAMARADPDRAAELFELALRFPLDGVDPSTVEAQYAEALLESGDGLRAGEAFERAIEALPPGDRSGTRGVALSCQAADAYLRIGRFERGIAHLEATLRAVGVPPAGGGRRAAVVRTGYQLKAWALRPLRREPSPHDAISNAQRLRLDALLTAGLGLGWPATVLSSVYLAQHLYESVEVGDATHLAAALAAEGAMLSFPGNPALRAIGRRCIERARQLARELDDPALRAFAAQNEGAIEYTAGRWGAAVEVLEEALGIYRQHCRGPSWELSSARYMCAWSHAMLGDLDAVEQGRAELIEDASMRGDVLSTAPLRVGPQNMSWLVRADPRRAREEARRAVVEWPDQGYSTVHFQAMMAQVQVSLYLGEPTDAQARLDAARDDVRRSGLRIVQPLRVFHDHLLGSTAVAKAIHAPPARVRRRALARARTVARRLEREGLAWASALAASMRAGVASVEGDWPATARALREAERCFTVAEMRVYAAAARSRLDALGSQSTPGPRLDAYAADTPAMARCLLPMRAPA
ncbi:MAG: protein kinase [Myxococcales bacterium]|nr:protein kinase [Myxococcales bacterium]